MKKLSLTVIGMYIGLLACFSQTSSDTIYKKRKISFEEANLVSSYYGQSGNHSAVTGGIGTEKLTDISNSIDVKFIWYDKKYRKHSISGELGIDHYTSASSDKIDPKTLSSASSADTRIYPSVNWTMENEKKGSAIGAGVSFSTEFDYRSVGANINFAQKTNNRSGEISAKASVYLDQVTLIYPVELRPTNQQGEHDHDDHYGTSPRNSINGELGYSQIINKNFQIAFSGELVYQDGYLSLPFHRVYFNDNSIHIEKLPSTRFKVPLAFRANYFAGDNLIIRIWYRNYHDDWGINSNSVQLETVYKITPFFSVTPFYRFYKQSGADQFAGFQEHTSADEYYTSNFDLSKFNSNFFGAGFRIAPPNGVLKIKHINSLELRYGHYQKTTDLNANIVTLHLKFT